MRRSKQEIMFVASVCTKLWQTPSFTMPKSRDPDWLLSPRSHVKRVCRGEGVVVVVAAAAVCRRVAAVVVCCCRVVVVVLSSVVCQRSSETPKSTAKRKQRLGQTVCCCCLSVCLFVCLSVCVFVVVVVVDDFSCLRRCACRGTFARFSGRRQKFPPSRPQTD